MINDDRRLTLYLTEESFLNRNITIAISYN